jgi:uncharacterized membrane protein YdfJ with MMPL/SSD domain
MRRSSQAAYLSSNIVPTAPRSSSGEPVSAVSSWRRRLDQILLHASVIRRSSGARMSLMWRFGASMNDAVAHGIKSTAGVVTGAAIVMVAVFSIFATLSLLFFKQFGVGLAAAILIDATLVRAVLLPATMKLLGYRNWYLPKWLEWLPRVEPEEPSKAPEAPPAPVSA